MATATNKPVRKKKGKSKDRKHYPIPPTHGREPWYKVQEQYSSLDPLI